MLRFKEFLIIVFLAFTVDQAQWVQTNGPGAGWILSLAVKDSLLFAGTDRTVFRSADNGGSWIAVNNGLPITIVRSLVVHESTVYAGTSDGLFRSIDGGDYWSRVNMGVVNKDIQTLLVSGTTLHAGTNSSVLSSTTNGESWIEISKGLTNSYVYSLAVWNSSLYAGTHEGVFRLSDNGEFWTEVDNGLRRFTLGSRMQILATSESALFVGIYGGVIRSKDNGKTWEKVYDRSGYIRSFGVTDSILFAGTDYGVVRSTDNGDSWTLANSGLREDLRASSFVVKDSMVYAGTQSPPFEGMTSLPSGFGFDDVWKRPLAEFTSPIGPGHDVSPFDFLNPQYPSGGIITFLLARNAFVKLTLYDLKGREVDRLMRGSLDRGIHTATLKENLPGGLYILRLQANGESRERRVLVEK